MLLEGGCVLSLRKSQKVSAAGRWRCTESEEEPEGNRDKRISRLFWPKIAAPRQAKLG